MGAGTHRRRIESVPHTLRARDGIGRWGLWSLVLLLALGYYGSLFTPPPPSTNALAIGGIIFGWVFVSLAWWVDRHREVAAVSVYPGAPAPGLAKVVENLDHLLHLFHRVVAVRRKANRALAEAAHHVRALHAVIGLDRFRRRDAEDRRAVALVER